MTKMPLERQKRPKTHLTPRKGLIYLQNIEMNEISPKPLDYLNNTRGAKINPNSFAHPNPPI